MTSFDDDDEVVVVGRPLPRLVSIAPMDGFNVAVTWHAGTRAKERDIVDLAVLLARFKVYAPLRDDPELFRTVRLQDHRYGVTWGDGSIDMGASTIADVADEAMTAEDFTAFMDRHGFTLDRAAAELGISRRMAAYYRKEHRVPRTVALACRYIDVDAYKTGSNTANTFERSVEANLAQMFQNNIGRVIRDTEVGQFVPRPANDEIDASQGTLRSIVLGIMSDQITTTEDIKRIAGFLLDRMEMKDVHLRSITQIESIEHAKLG